MGSKGSDHAVLRISVRRQRRCSARGAHRPCSGKLRFHLQFDDAVAFEFYYSRQDTKLEFRERAIGNKVELFDMAVEYYQVGGVYHFSEDNIQPFVSFGAGVTRWAAKTDLASDEWQFSLGGGGGGVDAPVPCVYIYPINL